MKTNEDTKVMGFLTEEAAQCEKIMKDLLDRVTKGGWANALEWNLTDDLAKQEMRKYELNNLLSYLDNNSLDSPATINILQAELRQVEESLLGHGQFGSDEGPWDSHSTSHGHNRLSIIRANHKRWFRGILLRVLKTAGATEKKS